MAVPMLTALVHQDFIRSYPFTEGALSSSCVDLFPGILGLSLVWEPYLIVYTAQLMGLSEGAGCRLG